MSAPPNLTLSRPQPLCPAPRRFDIRQGQAPVSTTTLELSTPGAQDKQGASALGFETPSAIHLYTHKVSNIPSYSDDADTSFASNAGKALLRSPQVLLPFWFLSHIQVDC